MTAIKGGQILHFGNTTLIERLQTAGPGLNVPKERVYELGNYLSVAISHDTPDITFTMESWDVTTDVEELLTGDSGTIDMSACRPIDIASQFKAGKGLSNEFVVVESVALPFLTVESCSYRFGAKENAAQTFTLRGDSIHYNPGASVIEQFTASGSSGQTLLLAHPAGVYNGDVVAGPRRALGIMVGTKRLVYGVDYTEALSGPAGAFRTVTITVLAAQTTGATIQVIYFTNDTVTYDQTTHTDSSTKPANIRGKDITMLVNGVAVADRYLGVQSVQVDQRFTLERTDELGNSQAVSQDYGDAPVVNGNVVVRFRDLADLHARLQEALGISASTESIGPLQFDQNRIDFVLHHPETGAVLKTLEITDAVVELPGFQGRANATTDWTLNFESDSGQLTVLDSAPS